MAPHNAMNCKRGGIIVVRHNNVRDFAANLLKTIQNNVEIEPTLQEIDNERIDGRKGMKHGLTYELEGVWRQRQNAFFDIL